MKTLYLDLFSGISGDMFVGALIDLGVDVRRLERELKKLKLASYRLHAVRQQKSGIEGVKFDVHLTAGQHHGHHAPLLAVSKQSGDGIAHGLHRHDDSRNFAEIKRLISRSRLSNWVKQKSIAVFQRIAEAEGKIHGLPPAKVHFHEVGAVDSIVDIAGVCIGLEVLGKPRVFASPVLEGFGWVDCAHGRFPVPAPATLAILGARGVGVTQCDEPHELVTPTGAALLAEFVEHFGPMQNLAAEKIGFGLGTRENQTRPNVLRVIWGSGECQVSRDVKSPRATASYHTSPVARHAPDWETDRIAVLETNLDDVNSEILGHFMETTMAAGALDVFFTPIQMKKNRPGILLTVLCAEAEADKFSRMILSQTSAFGLRQTFAERRKLRREFSHVQTRFGKVTIKLGNFNDKVVQAAPEFESCKKLAARAKVPLKQIYAAAECAIRAENFRQF